MPASHLIGELERRDEKNVALNKPSHQSEKINHDDVGPQTTSSFVGRGIVAHARQSTWSHSLEVICQLQNLEGHLGYL